MTWAVLTINIKGGTGKTMCAIETAKHLRDAGYNVGLMDADIDSSNLASRLGTDKKVNFEGDHTVKPVEHDGLKLYSMENAFDDSSFSQSGDFMKEVIDNMAHHSNWGDLDYLIIDCPPGSSDVFEELVRAFRANILGAISVGIPAAVEDTARLVKVCNHNWVPVIGFIENMSGMYCHGDVVECGEGHPVEPFGSGKIEKFVENVNGNYLGNVPLCADDTEVSEVAGGVFDNAVEAIEEAEQPELPEDNLGDKGFIRNVWGSIKEGISKMNEDMDIEELQEKFGVEGRDPLVMSLELTDATGIKGIFSEVIITVDGGDIKVVRPKTAEKQGIAVEGGMRVSSQDLYNAIRGEKTVMRSVTGDIISEPYSITESVKMGDAEVWGDRTVNRLAVLDRILTDVVDMTEIRKIMNEN